MSMSCRRLAGALLAFLLTGEISAQAPGGWIQDGNWLLLGPMGNPGGCNPMDTIDDNWIAPEEIAAVAPSDGEPAPIDFDLAASSSWQGVGDSPVWTCLGGLGLAGNDLVDMVAVAGLLSATSGKAIPSTDAMAVLVTYVENLTPSPVPVHVCSASDDSIQIWVNDQEVQEVRACRGTADGCAEEAAAVLVPGINAIKVLLWQGTGGWSFRLRLNRLDTGRITSFDSDFAFPGCDGADPAALNAYRVARRLGTDTLECAVPGGVVDVILDGDPTPGADLTLTETILGAAAVEAITHGGVFTPTPAPPAAPVGIFQGTADVGSPCAEGSAVENPDGSYTVTGSGFDIWTEGDNFRFAYREAHGDFSLTARVSDRVWAPASRWGKVGIMARQGLSGRSRYSMIQTHGEDLQDADRFAARRTHGGADNFEETNLLGGEHRDWMRLERIGSLFVGSFSFDGIDWQPAGSLDWGADAPHTVLLGLAVTSHAGCDPTTITFSDVTLTGGDQAPGPLAPDGGTIVWSGLPRATLDAGVGYRLRGTGQVTLHGHEGEHAVEGPSSVLLQESEAAAGVFASAHDIGAPCFRGSTTYDPGAGSYTVIGGGADIWEGNDQFQFAYSRMEGDFSLRARVVSRDWAPGVQWGKAGLMARQSCDPDSRYSFLHDSPDPDSTRYAIQRVNGAASNQEFGQGGHPAWLRLDRVGESFSGYSSEDGVVWTFRYSEEWIDPVPSSVVVGLALTSNEACVPSTLVFDQVTLAPIDYTVARRAGSGQTGCPDPAGGSSVRVVLTGSGPPGPSVILQEEVRGQVQVSEISHGGVFTPWPAPPAGAPVGIFHDARDVGAPCIPGSTVENPDGSYTITGGGVDIWQTGDQFQFAYVNASGDFSFTTRIAERNWAPGSRWGKVGLMARQSLDPRSRYLGVQDHGVDLQDQTRWASRPTHAGTDNYESVPLLAGEHHDWMRLERAGDLFIGYSSLDGTTWIEQGREVWRNAPATVLLGLEVCSHMDCQPAIITFADNDYVGGEGPSGRVPDGGTISWNVPRAALDAGVSYRVTSNGNGFAAFQGSADGVSINGDASFSTVAVEQLPGELPTAMDVGGPCTQGSTDYDPGAGAYTITSSGTDIWQGGDQFHFAHREISDDYFVAIAHIAERRWAPGSRWGKVGLMARQDCTPRSRYAMIQEHGEDPQDQGRFAARPTHGGADNFEQWSLPVGVHHDWMRLDRAGSVFTGFTSTDGQNWERQGSVDFGATAPPTVLLGLAVCGHDGCDPATIVFDQFRIEAGANNPPVACIQTIPSPPQVFLSGGSAQITLDAGCAHDGDGGAQGLVYSWARLTGPAGMVIENRNAASTRVTFDRVGTYRIRLTVNDGQLNNNIAAMNIDVAVTDRPPAPTFRRGDPDSSGGIDLSDAIGVLQHLFLGGARPVCWDAADTDDNGAVDISDPIANLQYQFLGGAAPAAPGPSACGPDPTAESPDLGCDRPCA